MLNYIAIDPTVQIFFLILIGVIIVVAFVCYRWAQSEKNDFKREIKRHEWAKEERQESKNKSLTVVRSDDD